MEYKMMTFSEEIINLFNDDHYDYLAIHFCLSYVEIQAMLLQLNGYMFNAEEIYLSIESLVKDKFLKKKKNGDVKLTKCGRTMALQIQNKLWDEMQNIGNEHLKEVIKIGDGISITINKKSRDLTIYRTIKNNKIVRCDACRNKIDKDSTKYFKKKDLSIRCFDCYCPTCETGIYYEIKYE